MFKNSRMIPSQQSAQRRQCGSKAPPPTATVETRENEEVVLSLSRAPDVSGWLETRLDSGFDATVLLMASSRGSSVC